MELFFFCYYLCLSADLSQEQVFIILLWEHSLFGSGWHALVISLKSLVALVSLPFACLKKNRKGNLSCLWQISSGLTISLPFAWNSCFEKNPEKIWNSTKNLLIPRSCIKHFQILRNFLSFTSALPRKGWRFGSTLILIVSICRISDNKYRPRWK